MTGTELDLTEILNSRKSRRSSTSTSSMAARTSAPAGSAVAVQRRWSGNEPEFAPMRIGANSGSLPDHLRWTATADPAGALVRAAMEEVEVLERLDFREFKISVKSSSVPVMIEAYRRLAELVPYPLHLGVTEAGLPAAGTIKSAIGIGTLLAESIGDTIRVSLTADPVQEVQAAFEILKALGLRPVS